MVCDPSQNTINITPGVPPSIPGMGPPFSVPKIPYPDVVPLENFPEDILALIDRFFAILPTNLKLIPNVNSLTKNVWDILASLFDQLAPFLALYSFFQALLNIILCIFDVFCSLIWGAPSALIRVFKKCLPDFLSLFPWLALLAMIIALLLLLLALIEYLIQQIVNFINKIIQNFKVLAKAMQRSDEDGILSCIQKISEVLCLLEQLFAMLYAIAALFAIIEPLMGIIGRGVCSDSGDCCSDPALCPPFLKGNSSGTVSADGYFTYYNQVVTTDGIVLRNNMWQFYDRYAVPGSTTAFSNVITVVYDLDGKGHTYWPEGESYSTTANPDQVPYNLDMLFDKSGKTYSVQKAIVTLRPSLMYQEWNNNGRSVDSGVLNIGGGLVYEANIDGSGNIDGYIPVTINGVQATLNTFIYSNPSTTYPGYDDTQYYTNVKYNFKPNHNILFSKNLVGMMCNPDTAAEAAILNAQFNDLRSVGERIGALPNVTAAIVALQAALAAYRKNMTPETSAAFQQACTDILNKLGADTAATVIKAINAAMDRYHSEFTIHPDLQFTDQKMLVTFIPKDYSGASICPNLPVSVSSQIELNIIGEPTLGTISSFKYDGYNYFIAELSSEEAGSGELKIKINGEYVSRIDTTTTPSTNTIVTVPYKFVSQVATYGRPYTAGEGPGAGGDHTGVERDNR